MLFLISLGLILLRNLDSFANTLSSYNALNNSPNPNYTWNIKSIKIQIVKENQGGCYEGGQDKITKTGNVKCINPRSRNNDCFFECLNILDCCVEKFKGMRFKNNIRSIYGLDRNSPIPFSVAFKIFEKYKKPDETLEIIDEETKQTLTNFENGLTTLVKDVGHTIKLSHGHYQIVESYKMNKCDKCLKKYRTIHNCSANRASYVNCVMKQKLRRVLNKKQEPQENNKDSIIHFDIESVPLEHNGNRIHTPYILGYNEGNEFKYITGWDCMSKFVDYLLGLPEEKKYFINAFNGANFDHYMFYHEFLKRGLTPEKFILNNGSLIQFQYKNLHLFDIAKHLGIGKLSDQLNAYKCDVVK